MHSPGEADLNLYAYVSGQVLKNVDPLGLAHSECELTVGSNASSESAGAADVQSAPVATSPPPRASSAPAPTGPVQGPPADAATPYAPPAPEIGLPEGSAMAESASRPEQGKMVGVQSALAQIPPPYEIGKTHFKLARVLADIRDDLYQKSSTADNGVEKVTGYMLTGFMSSVAMVTEVPRAFVNVPGKLKQAWDYSVRATKQDDVLEAALDVANAVKAATEAVTDAFPLAGKARQAAQGTLGEIGDALGPAIDIGKGIEQADKAVSERKPP